MGRRKVIPDDPFADRHYVRGYIERRLSQLRSDGPVGDGLMLGRPERDAILGFVRAREGVVGELRVRTYLAWLPAAAAKLGVGFLAPERATLPAFGDAFPSKRYARASRAAAAECLTTFWRWNFERAGREYPSWLRIKLEKWRPTNGASDMLTREEVASIADQAQSFRDRAWIWTLFNSGCRPGEIYQLRVGDVVPHDEGYIELRVTREKGSAPEPAPVYEDAVPALLAWLSAHPRRDNPASPLWVNLAGDQVGKVATYRAMCKALESAARRARITKPVTAYALRRSRLTLLAKDPAISTWILEKVAGWVPGSKVARHYVHLSGKDVISAMNARYGVKVPAPGEKSEAPRVPSKCGRCKTVNPSGAAYCMTCGGPLSLPAVKQIEETTTSEERLAELLRRPEAIELMARLLAEQGKGKDRAGRGTGKSADGDGGGDGDLRSPDALPKEAAGPPQRVVSIAEAEQLIRSGYEFVAPFGNDRAVLRAPPNFSGQADHPLR